MRPSCAMSPSSAIRSEIRATAADARFAKPAKKKLPDGGLCMRSQSVLVRENYL